MHGTIEDGMHGRSRIQGRALDGISAGILRYAWGDLRTTADTPSAFYWQVCDEINDALAFLWSLQDMARPRPAREGGPGEGARGVARDMVISAVRMYLKYDRDEIEGTPAEREEIVREVESLMDRFGEEWPAGG